MSLVVLSGPVRGGKSSMAESLAAGRGYRVVVAVAGWEGDEEIARRIAAHAGSRPSSWETRTVGADPSWIADVPCEAVLVLDCLGTLVGTIAHEEVGDGPLADMAAESRAQDRTDALVHALLQRRGDTVVVTNEAGWGVVPPSASGRLFRDLLGRANRALVDGSGAAYLVVDGRVLDLKALPLAPSWPDID